jgi:hypothetical protein
MADEVAPVPKPPITVGTLYRALEGLAEYGLPDIVVGVVDAVHGATFAPVHDLVFINPTHGPARVELHV